MIQLGQPWALLALASIPLIVLLHVLRPRRRTVPVSTIALWHAALKDRRRGLGLRRLLSNLSLLLLLLFALTAALGLTAPQWSSPSDAPGDTVLVLDVSASMNTRSGAGTRFDEALAAAFALVDALPLGSRMLLMTSGRNAVLRSGFEADRETLRGALRAVVPTHEAGRPGDALALALSLLGGREGARVVFLSDGAFDAHPSASSPRVEHRLVGGPARNVAITRFDVRPEMGGDAGFQVLLTVRNYTDEAVQVPTSVSLERRPLVERTVTLEPGGEQTLVLPIPGRHTGRAGARIRVEDDLDADNHAYAVANVIVPTRVLLVSPGNFYLDSVLGALANVEVTHAREVEPGDLAQQAARHDVVVLDQVQAPALPAGSFMLVDTLAPELPFTGTGVVPRPRIQGVGDSALVRDVDLTGVRIEHARRVRITGEAPGLQRLFWSEHTDLALALLDARRRVVYLGFDLSASNFPLLSAFPQFFGQAMAWLRPGDADLERTQLAAGERFVIRAPSHAREAIMRLPSGEGLVLPLHDGALEFAATSQAGIYSYTVEQVARHFAVNASDARESDVNRRWTPARPQDPAAEHAQATVVTPLWPYLAVLALALLALEWGVWCARRGHA